MLETLLYPKAIAVIGASRNPGKVGYAVLANLVNNGFKGPIIPVNPEADEILGLKCYKSIGEYKGPIDLSIIMVGAKYVKDALQSSIKAGAKSVIVITAGFKEVGAEGAKAEQELVEICRAGGVRMVGPNCLGVLNTDHHMNATFAPSVPPPGKISVISQSGALCVAILDWAAEQKLGLGKVISFGNKADLNEVDFIETLAEDKETKVIAGYLESIKEGDKFLRIAEQAASVKPVVILKVGITSAGAKPPRHTPAAWRAPTWLTARRSSARGSFGRKISRRCSIMRRPLPCSRSRMANAWPSSPTPAAPASWRRTPLKASA